jgi:hypothetical protein
MSVDSIDLLRTVAGRPPMPYHYTSNGSVVSTMSFSRPIDGLTRANHTFLASYWSFLHVHSSLSCNGSHCW